MKMLLMLSLNIAVLCMLVLPVAERDGFAFLSAAHEDAVVTHDATTVNDNDNNTSAYPLLKNTDSPSTTITCGSIVNNSVVVLAADVGPCSGDGLVIGADNVNLNCNGHTIISVNNNVSNTKIFTLTKGINITGHSRVSIDNCKVTGFTYGFYLVNATNNKLNENTATNNARVGFDLYSYANNNTLIKNTATNNDMFGFDLSNANNNTLIKNTATNNEGGGFGLLSSKNNTLAANSAVNNKRHGFSLFYSNSNNTLIKNTATNNEGAGFYVTGFYSYANNNTLIKNTATNNEGAGFDLSNANNNTLIKNTATNNEGGFLLGKNTHDNYIRQSTAYFNGKYGIEDNNTNEANMAKMKQRMITTIIIITTTNSTNTILPGSSERELQPQEVNDNYHNNKYSGNQCGGNALGESILSGLCMSINNTSRSSDNIRAICLFFSLFCSTTQDTNSND
jgi:parallel beta-helix repeat protein